MLTKNKQRVREKCRAIKRVGAHLAEQSPRGPDPSIVYQCAVGLDGPRRRADLSQNRLEQRPQVVISLDINRRLYVGVEVEQREHFEFKCLQLHLRHPGQNGGEVGREQIVVIIQLLCEDDAAHPQPPPVVRGENARGLESFQVQKGH